MTLPKDGHAIGEVYALLHRLGATANYTGFLYTAYAVQLAVREPQYLQAVTKCLYPEIAQRCGATWRAVEKNIRTVIGIIWEANPALLSELAKSPLHKKPSTAQFIAILAAHFWDTPL